MKFAQWFKEAVSPFGREMPMRYYSQDDKKPSAIISAGDERINHLLQANIRNRGLSSTPVSGGFRVKPLAQMGIHDFIDAVRLLLWNPTGEQGKGPFANTQEKAKIEIPGGQSFILARLAGQTPIGPQDYNQKISLDQQKVDQTKVDTDNMRGKAFGTPTPGKHIDFFGRTFNPEKKIITGET